MLNCKAMLYFNTGQSPIIFSLAVDRQKKPSKNRLIKPLFLPYDISQY